jgi:hypothetical protein
VEQEIEKKKATNKPFVVNRKIGNGKKKVKVDLSTELNQLSKQDCFDYMAAVAKLHSN